MTAASAASPAFSETDVRIFRLIADPNVVDLEQATLEKLKSTTNVPGTTTAPSPRMPSPLKTPSSFVKALANADNGACFWTPLNPPTSDTLPLLPTKSTPPSTLHFTPSAFSQQVREQLQQVHTPVVPPRSSPVLLRSTPAPHAEPQYEEKYTGTNEKPPSPNFYGTRDDKETDDTRQNKQYALIELSKLESHGFVLSRKFTMNDDLAEMLYEIDSVKGLKESSNMVGYMRQGLGLGFRAVETLNKHAGPFLKIDGWSDSLSRDMTKFNSPLEKIYKQYLKKRTMNPFVEMAWIIALSLVTTHLSNVLSGGFGSNASNGSTGSDNFQHARRRHEDMPFCPQPVPATPIIPPSNATPSVKRRTLGAPTTPLG